MDKKAQMFLNRAQVVRDVRNLRDARMPFLAPIWTKSVGNTLYVIAASRAAKTVTGMGVPESHPPYPNDSCWEDNPKFSLKIVHLLQQLHFTDEKTEVQKGQ